MYNQNRVVWVLMGALAVGVAHAGQRLNDAELKEFFEDKTVTGVHHKRGLSNTYFGADGSVQSKSEDGTQRSGKWWIEDGKRCIRWDHKAKDFCHYVERDDDGSYALVHSKKGKRLVEIRSRARGNAL